jgi:hypothetical protein
VLAGCPIVHVPAAGIGDLPDAVLLVVEAGVVLLGRADARRIVMAVAGPGHVLAPPGDGQELRGLTAARVTAVTRDAGRALMAVPGAASAVARALPPSLPSLSTRSTLAPRSASWVVTCELGWSRGRV